MEVTDWVFQMTSYLSIFFFVMAAGLIFNLDSKKRVFVALALIFGSVAVNPIRAHGIFLTLWLVMIMGLISERRSKRKFLVVLLLFSIILFLFLLNKQTFGDPVANTAMLNPGIAVVRSSFEVGDLTIPAHYFRNLGSGLIPNSIVEELSKLNITQVLLRSYHPGIEIVVWAGGMLGFLLFYKRYLFANRNSRVLIVIYSVAILTFVYLANKILLASNLTVNSRISATFGFTFLFTMVLFTIFDAINKNAEKAKLDALILGVCGFFILVPWIHDPINHLTTTHRYLIFSSLLAPLLLADFSSSLLSSRKIIVYIGILLLIGTFASITVFEIDQMSKRHGRFYGETLWGQIDRYFGDENLKDERSVVYFASDNNRQLHDLIISSFGFRMGLYYDIWDFDKLPYAIESLDDFRSMLTDGEASFKYIGKVHTFEMKDAYAFEIKDNQVRKLDISKLLY
ncbi:hypothetical protein HY385_00395 [Candidatus Daviesbacteria bacterium]|nr:hypothetical protein [Candidatus Daviesbacteria bacterium]